MQLGLGPALAMAMLAIMPASAQERADFSGEWVRAEPPPDLASALTVVQDSESITIRQIFPNPRSGTYRLNGVAAGHVAGIEGGAGVSEQSSAGWKGASVVITEERSMTQSGDTRHRSTHEEVWSLDPNRQLVIVVTDEQTGAAPITTRFVYRKAALSSDRLNDYGCWLHGRTLLRRWTTLPFAADLAVDSAAFDLLEVVPYLN